MTNGQKQIHGGSAQRATALLRTSALVVLLCCAANDPTTAQVLQLHPQNPRYFLWKGKPMVLITSGEHYGAVLNLDFNYSKYLETLAADHLNLTRTFSGGAYFEPQGAFKIAQNTLAPAPGRFIAPWARSDTPGFAGGGEKFDLTRWNPAYFARLRDFVSQASERGVVVEMNLFCPFYGEEQWRLSPFNASNNVNDVGHVSRTNVYTLDQDGGLLAFQEKMVVKFVDELRDFDNVYYEICNEPYFGGVTLPWQRHIAEVITQAQKDHARPKLISQNIANNSARIENPDPNVSIFNFHYATPPETVAMNYQLQKVIGDNETGFRGTNDLPYRTEGWEFMIAGGGLYNNLDYSFTVGREDGTFVYPNSQPGGGTPALRRELRILQEFISRFNFVNMRPDDACIRSCAPAGLKARALTDKGKAYAIYLRSESSEPESSAVLELELTAGSYQAEWVDTKNGAIKQVNDFKHEGGTRKLTAPRFSEDIALAIKARG